MTTFYKIKNGLAPTYLAAKIPERNETDAILRGRVIREPFSRTERFDNSFFPFCIKNWNILDESIKSLPSIGQFKSHINNFIRPKGHGVFGIRDKLGINLLTKIRVEFSDLRDHRFNHNFNCACPTCDCGIEDETSLHFFLCCPRYRSLRSSFLSKISDIIHSDVVIFPGEHLLHIILYGSNVFNHLSNKLIIEQTIHYIKQTGRFKQLEAFS